MLVGAGCGDFYLDAIGFGAEPTNWSLIEGTSMATPSVAGQAAIVAKMQVDEGPPRDLNGQARSGCPPLPLSSSR